MCRWIIVFLYLGLSLSCYSQASKPKVSSNSKAQSGVNISSIQNIMREFGVKESISFTKLYQPVSDSEVFLIDGNKVFSKYKIFYKNNRIESVSLRSESPEIFRKNKEYILSATRRAFGKELSCDCDEDKEIYYFKKGKEVAELYFSVGFNDESYNNIGLAFVKE